MKKIKVVYFMLDLFNIHFYLEVGLFYIFFQSIMCYYAKTLGDNNKKKRQGSLMEFIIQYDSNF